MSAAPPVPASPAAHPGPRARPERLLIVARRVEDGRFLFARWPDWPHPAMLSTLSTLSTRPPRGDEASAAESDAETDAAIAATVDSLLHGRLGVHVVGPVRSGARRLPVRMLHPAGGGPGLGWLRPVAAEVAGAPAPDALLAAVAALTFDAALAALPTAVEREAFRAGAALFDVDGG